MQKVIKGHPDYTITDSGEVISFKGKQPRILIPDFASSYARVSIDGEKRYIADLVAEAFLPEPEKPNCKIFYIDGNKANYSLENIAWLTPSEIQLFTQYTLEYRKQMLGRW